MTTAMSEDSDYTSDVNGSFRYRMRGIVLRDVTSDVDAKAGTMRSERCPGDGRSTDGDGGRQMTEVGCYDDPDHSDSSDHVFLPSDKCVKPASRGNQSITRLVR
jgi:hypothetical protein